MGRDPAVLCYLKTLVNLMDFAGGGEHRKGGEGGGGKNREEGEEKKKEGREGEEGQKRAKSSAQLGRYREARSLVMRSMRYEPPPRTTPRPSLST